MGLHHPITDWCLNGKHTSIKPCHEGGRFCLHSPQRCGYVEEKVGGWAESWINMALRCVTIPAQRCTSLHHIFLLLITILWTTLRVGSLQLTPRVSFSLHWQDEMLKLTFKLSVSLFRSRVLHWTTHLNVLTENLPFSLCNGPFCSHFGSWLLNNNDLAGPFEVVKSSNLFFLFMQFWLNN